MQTKHTNNSYHIITIPVPVDGSRHILYSRIQKLATTRHEDKQNKNKRIKKTTKILYHIIIVTVPMLLTRGTDEHGTRNNNNIT